MRLHRPAGPAPLSLVSMVDVLMIMLVFFMVTSTFLNLDMLPMAGRADADAAPPAAATAAAPLVLRLGADGRVSLRGRVLDGPALAAELAARAASDPLAEVAVLPSAHARTEALVGLMDAAAAAGIVRLRVLRVEAAP